MSKINTITEVYFKLLKSLDWEDEVLITGLREGLNKFLSNSCLFLGEKINIFKETSTQKQLQRKLRTTI